MPRIHDVAIYAPFASMFYEADLDPSAGGAELQTTLLARGLAEQGLRTAHVVYPPTKPVELSPPAPVLVPRKPFSGTGSVAGVREAMKIWGSFRAADAAVYIVRSSGAHLVPAAAFCRAHGRALVFSASNDLDFDLERPGRSPWRLRAYAQAVRRTDRLVVQTGQQQELARATFPTLDPVLIPSFGQFAEPSGAEPRYFLWADRIVDYKHPLAVLDLAEATPEASFRMVCVRTKETAPELDAEVRERAARLENLELLEPRPRVQLLDEIAGATAIVSTSEVEGMPNTFLEAWARGVPALSLRVDPDDRIAERGAGIVAGGSPERFAAGARELWADRALRDRLGAQGRAFVREHHSPDAVAGRWADLLRPLVEGRTGTLSS